MAKKILLLIFLTLAYLLYTRFVLNPEALKNFSLIDDGQLIKYGYYLRECLTNNRCISFKTQIIDVLPDVGLSRAGAWFIHGLLYQGSWIDAGFQHSLRAYGLGLIMVILLILAGFSTGVGAIAIFLGVAIFVTNYSFTENMVRLGPNEPFMVIFLGIFSLIFLNFYRIPKKYRIYGIFALFFSLIYFLLIKEATIAILPAILISGLLYPKLLERKILITLFVVSGAIYFLVKYLLRGPAYGFDYAGNYNLNLVFVLRNSLNYINLLINSLTPFFAFMLIITPVLVVVTKIRKIIVDVHLAYWLLVFIFFTAINFPWKYVYDRYLLPAIFAFSIFILIFVGRIIKESEKTLKLPIKSKIFFNMVIILVLSNLLFTGISGNIARTISYRNWYAMFTQFEADQVKAISSKNKTVYLNAKDIIENWEVTYEIPMHINYFYGGKPEVKILGQAIPSKGFIFSASSLVPLLEPDTLSKNKYPITDSGQYDLFQIDVDKFSQMSRLQPIQAFQKPPLNKENTGFYWEIREIK